MIKRYQVEEIEAIWSDHNKYKTWLEIEQLIVEAWNYLGYVPSEDVKKIKNLRVDLNRMWELEIQTKHDVVAFTRMLTEQLGSESRWIHLGVTSTDIVDTAQNWLIKESNKIVAEGLNNLKATLKKLAFKHQNQLIMGRTHGMYGEPISLGLKFALWYREIVRQETRFNLARQQIEVAKISGSMGNYANLELEIENYVALKTGLDLDLITTQVTQRDRHAFLIEVFANIASTLEKIATEIRLFQRSDVNEMAEGFTPGQKGSSSMPHKKNPIASENITGLGRYIRTFVSMALENNVLWHERDISHSSNERIIFPDIYSTLVFSLKRTNNILLNLYINFEQINKHLNSAQDLFFSQRVLTYILMHNTQVTREEVYDFIQDCTFETVKTKANFKTVLIKNGIEKFITLDQLANLFDINFFNRQTTKIMDRIFAH